MLSSIRGSLNVQNSRCCGAIEIVVLDEKCSGPRARSGGDLQGQVNDSQSGRLLGDDADVAVAGNGVGHAGIESGLREKTNVGGGGSACRSQNGNSAPTEVAGIRSSDVRPNGGHIKIQIADRGVHTRAGWLDYDDVVAA